VHDGVRGNVAAHVRQSRGNYAAGARGRRSCDRPALPLRSWRVVADRDRGIVAQMGRPSQSAHDLGYDPGTVFFRNGIAAMLNLSERQVRVIAPFVGGGFGRRSCCSIRKKL